MKRHIAWLALAISILFNVFFLAGYTRAKWRLDDSTTLAANVKDELRLDDGQAAIFGHMRNDLQEDNRLFMERQSLGRQQIFSEMSRDQPDAERIQMLMEQDGELRRQMRQATQERFRAFLSMLSPEQRQRLLHRLDGGQRDGKRRRMHLRRFDNDGDGKLDEVEQNAAREFMEQRHRERTQRRERMLERFDANGDGALDPAERASMRRWSEANRDGNGEDL
jgi:uncharacterized membrane protein